MVSAEIARLKNYDRRQLHTLSGEERLEYIMLLRKLRSEVQMSLDFALQPLETPTKRGNPRHK